MSNDFTQEDIDSGFDPERFRMQEIRPKKPLALESLADESIRRISDVARRLKRHADENPDMPFVALILTPGMPASDSVALAYACGAARCRILFDLLDGTHRLFFAAKEKSQ